MCKSMAIQIREQIGQLIEVDLGSCGLSLGRYPLIRVKVDISKPILRSIAIVAKAEEKPVATAM